MDHSLIGWEEFALLLEEYFHAQERFKSKRDIRGINSCMQGSDVSLG